MHADTYQVRKAAELLHSFWGLIPARRTCKEMECGQGCFCATKKKKKCKVHGKPASTSHRRAQRAALLAVKELSVEHCCALVPFPEFGVKGELFTDKGFKGVTRMRSGQYGRGCCAVFDVLVVAPAHTTCCVVEIQDGGDLGHVGSAREDSDHNKQLFCGSNKNVIRFAEVAVPRHVHAFQSQSFKAKLKIQLRAKLSL